ncbi:MAG: TIGR00266 family protein [Actinomycetota bacterium]|nr:TIGR00266 family protein [Actinomycetota bacterium]
MQVNIDYRPSYATAKVDLDPAENIVVEGGAMVAMSSDLELQTKARGGFLKSLGRATFGGESFFLNTYSAPASGGMLYLAPALPGDMKVLELSNETLMVQSGGYIASSPALNVDTKWSGAKTFFASEGLVMLKVHGTGTLIISAYGAIEELVLGPGEKFTVDTGHLVTFTEGMGFDVRKVGGWKSTLLSGEGLVVDLTGPGTATLQTRSEDAFLSWIIPKLPNQNASRA